MWIASDFLLTPKIQQKKAGGSYFPRSPRRKKQNKPLGKNAGHAFPWSLKRKQQTTAKFPARTRKSRKNGGLLLPVASETARSPVSPKYGQRPSLHRPTLRAPSPRRARRHRCGSQTPRSTAGPCPALENASCSALVRAFFCW